jgi:hypothetical protein
MRSAGTPHSLALVIQNYIVTYCSALAVSHLIRNYHNVRKYKGVLFGNKFNVHMNISHTKSCRGSNDKAYEDEI